MLSYQHAYHAGNFADVIKHQVLALTIDYMVQKDKPIFYLETHSGRGLYNLESLETQKTQEAQLGIFPLWQKKHQFSSLAPGYRQVLDKLNPNSNITYYPGSPTLAISLFRSQDRLYFNELHPQEYQYLTTCSKQHKKVYYAQEDGIQQLKALLPPPEKRALIFIDPAYELKTEYTAIPKAILQAFKHCSSGVYILWYPIINPVLHQQLLNALKHIPTDKTLKIEFNFTSMPQLNMHGCGLWIINPPYVLATKANAFLKELQQLFYDKPTSFCIEAGDLI